MAAVVRWSGREARALREAKRMSVREFAAHLGINDAAVSNWERRGDLARLRYQTQQILDIDFARCTAEVRERFDQILSTERMASVPAHVAEDQGAGAPPTPDVRWSLLSHQRADTTADPGQDDPDLELASVRAMWLAFRAADRQVGGGGLYPSVLRYLELEVGPRLVGPSGAASDELFCAAVALVELAGWMAHDGGNDKRALDHFRRALRLAGATGRPQLAAGVMASMSHLACQLGQPHEAVQAAQSGRQRAKAGDALPSLTARLYAMEARALAVIGDRAGCRRALTAAERAVGRVKTPPSDWLGHFDEGSLATEAAVCFTQIDEFDEAQRRAEHAISLRGGDQARSRAFSQLTLAEVHAARGEFEQACSCAGRVLEATRTVGSARISVRLRHLCRRLAERQDVPVVARFLEAAAARRTDSPRSRAEEP
jgi:transcriptional regulator with XRE-family HTH domain